MELQLETQPTEASSAETKECITCKAQKPLSEYYFVEKDGRRRVYEKKCKGCRCAKFRSVYGKTTLRKPVLGHPFCPKCSTMKTSADFHKDKHQKNGYTAWCKECRAKDGRVPAEKAAQYLETFKSKHSPFYYQLNKAALRAKANGIGFDITLEDIEVPALCPLLNVPMIRHTPYAPSLDRLDNSKGYVKGNVRVISRLANTMKSSASPEELLAFAQNIAAYIASAAPAPIQKGAPQS